MDLFFCILQRSVALLLMTGVLQSIAPDDLEMLVAAEAAFRKKARRQGVSYFAVDES